MIAVAAGRSPRAVGVVGAARNVSTK